MKSWHPLTRLLLLIAVPLLIAAWLIPTSNPTVITSVPRADSPAAVAQGGQGPIEPVPALETLDSTVQRPLFSPTRRAPAAPEPGVAVEEPAPSGPSPPTFSLRGIARAASGPIALLELAEGGSIRLRVGEERDGWTVGTIDARTVTLEAGDERTVLAVFPRPDQP